MTPDQKHSLGFFLMGVGVVSASLGVLLILPHSPILGAVWFLASLPLAGAGVWIKRKYCPRCRGKACTLPPDRAPRGDPH